MVDRRLVEAFVEAWNGTHYQKVTEGIINGGWCYQFALLVHKVYGGSLVSAHPWHAWVEVDGKSYDSEHLDGSLAASSGRGEGEVECLAEFAETWRTGISGALREDIAEAALELYEATVGEKAS